MKINAETDETFKKVKEDAQNFVNISKDMEASPNKYYKFVSVSSEFPDCSMPFRGDVYGGCSFGCNYCFSYFFRTNNPSLKNWSLKGVNSNKCIALMEGKMPNSPYYKYFFAKRKTLHIGGMSDMFCNFERKNKRFLPLLEYILKTGYPTCLSTKGDILSMLEHKALFEKYKDTAKIAIQFSIVSNDEELASFVETGVVSPKRRFENMKWLSDLGYYTMLRLRPFIIGVSDKTLLELLQNAKEAGAKSLSTEFFALDIRCNAGISCKYDWLSKLIGFDIEEFYEALSPSERGGYRRLNRDVKEQYVKIMYKFCKENNMIFAISDPDFKELNMTQSCCGLPDDPKYGLQNYFKNQWTAAIVDLRRRFYASNGKDNLLSVKDVFKHKDETDWWQDKKLVGDLIEALGMQTGELATSTLKKLLLQKWNNLRSSKNPYSYFHGLVKPVSKDNDGNLIFQYVPQNYEKKWIEEGIL